MHRKDCPNIQRERARLIEVAWNPNYRASSCPVEIIIRSTDRESIVVDVLNLLAQNKVNCSKILSKKHPETATISIQLTINVADTDHLNEIRNAIINVPNVYSVERVTH